MCSIYEASSLTWMSFEVGCGIDEVVSDLDGLEAKTLVWIKTWMTVKSE